MVSGKQNHYSPCVRRAMGICLAALVALAAVPIGHAQSVRRLPKSLLPAPGNVGITMNLMGVRTGQTAVTSQQHPLFDTSWTGHPDEIVAQTKYGSVSSRDLYLWMMLRESPNKAYLFEIYKKAKLPDERKELAEALRVEVDEYVFTNYVIPRLMPAAPVDPIYDLKHHLYTLPAWQTVFLQNVVKPTVTILEADRVKYLQEHTSTIVAPQRLRTRYIFMEAQSDAPLDDQGRTEVEMDELRTSILSGEISFADAARANSQAPSASNGGEIPPFQHGELFFLFENAAASVEPGGISPVFRGPRGFYMVQLIEVLEPEEPSLSNPEHAKQVDEALSRQVLKASYDIYMRDMLLERRRLVDKAYAWDSLEDCEMLGEVCDFQITKGQFRSAWPGVEDNSLQLRTDIIGPQLRTILEREAMVQETRDLGYAGDPLLERARWMSGNIIRRDAWIDQLRASLPISEQLVRNFWQDHPDLFTPLALKRVIKLTLVPSNTAPLPAQTRLELDKVLAFASGGNVTVAVADREQQDEERWAPVYDARERTEEAFQMLTAPSSEPNYYLDEYSTNSLQNLMISEPEEIPSLQGEPAPGLEQMPGPSAITTNTLDSLVIDTPTTSPVLDLPTTGSRGGAAPIPPSGGRGPVGILPDVEPVVPGSPADNTLPQAPPVNPSDNTLPQTTSASSTDNTLPQEATERPATGSTANYATTEELSGSPIISNQYSPEIRPATRPRSGSVPVGITAPAIAPGVTVQPTPNPRHHLKPPPTSAIPYNPDWFYWRIDPSDLQASVAAYASSDWLLSMQDLGFVYVPDLADAPRKLEQVPVGAFSRPVVRDRTAVSWYIEDARTVEKQPFEEIKTHVYDVYRKSQLDKAVSGTYNSELEKAGIDYKF